MDNDNSIADLTEEARTLGVLVYADDDSLTIRPDGGESSDDDVCIYADADALVASEVGDQAWPWNDRTIADYLAARSETNNWE